MLFSRQFRSCLSRMPAERAAVRSSFVPGYCSLLANKPTFRAGPLMGFRDSSTEAKVEAEWVLSELEKRVMEHSITSQALTHTEVLHWIREIRTVSVELPTVDVVTEEIRQAKQPARPVAGPLLRSLLVGVALGTTSPVFILLPWSIAFVPIGAFYGPSGVGVLLELVAPALLNTPIALANFAGAFFFALCREALVLRSGWSVALSNSKAIHHHGVVVGMATGVTTPFLAWHIAGILTKAGFAEPLTIAMSCVWHMVVDWPPLLMYLASGLLVSVPMGAGGGALLAMVVAPFFSAPPHQVLVLIVGLSGVWLATTAFLGLPVGWDATGRVDEAASAVKAPIGSNSIDDVCAACERAIKAGDSTAWKDFVETYKKKLDKASKVFGFP